MDRQGEMAGEDNASHGIKKRLQEGAGFRSRGTQFQEKDDKVCSFTKKKKRVREIQQDLKV